MAAQYQADLAIAEARSYIGTRWRHRGRSRFGIDCIGLLVAAMRAGGVVMRDRVDYGRYPWKDGIDQDLIAHFGDPSDFDSAQAGDVVLLCWGDKKHMPAHVGILSDSPRGLGMIHCHSQMKVSEHRIDAEWQAKIIGVFRP